MRWSEQPLDGPRRAGLGALWEEWVADNPFHWHDTGLRPGRPRWRSKWIWILWSMIALRVVWFAAALALMVWGGDLAVEMERWWRLAERGQVTMPGWLGGIGLFIGATSLIHLLLILLPSHLAAKSWQRDRPEAWREHLGAAPVTSRQVIFAKSHLWLALIFLGKIATLAMWALLALAVLGLRAAGGEWPVPVQMLIDAWRALGAEAGPALALWIPIGVAHAALALVKPILWWFLIFALIALLGLQGMGPLVNLTLVGLIVLAIGGALGTAGMVISFLAALIAPGPAAMVAVQAFISAGEGALIGAGAWFLWKFIARSVARQYHLSG